MIKLIYSKRISDPESFSATLAEQGITVLGISTLETKEESETHIFIDDNTDEETKGIIDDEMRKDVVSRPTEAPPPAEEEIITDEVRLL